MYYVFVLQLWAPEIVYRTPLSDLPYCNSSKSGPTYQTGTMEYPYLTATCVNLNQNEVVFPPDEANAMFITSRMSTSGVYLPSDGG